MAIGILLRAGVAHREVEKPVRPKRDAAAGVVLRHRRDRHDSPRRLARIGAQVRRGAELDERRHHLPRLHRLVFKVIFPVLAKLRMKCHAEQPVGPALRKHAGGKIAEQRLHKTLGGFFHPPNLAQLVGDQEHALAARHLSEPREPCADVSRLAHHGHRKTQRLVEERPQRHRLRQFSDDVRHTLMAAERRLRLLQAHEVFHDVGKLRERQRRVEPGRHERNGTAALR